MKKLQPLDYQWGKLVIDIILLQENGLQAKEILQNDYKKPRYGNGLEPFIQTIASGYRFLTACDGKTYRCD